MLICIRPVEPWHRPVRRRQDPLRLFHINRLGLPLRCRRGHSWYPQDARHRHAFWRTLYPHAFRIQEEPRRSHRVGWVKREH
jgi:hypothetical protein